MVLVISDVCGDFSSNFFPQDVLVGSFPSWYSCNNYRYVFSWGDTVVFYRHVRRVFTGRECAQFAQTSGG